MTRMPLLDVDYMNAFAKLDQPSYPAYVRAKWAMYGDGPLAALWCQVIRPWLMPRKQRQVAAQFGAAYDQFKTELRAAIEAQEPA